MAENTNNGSNQPSYQNDPRSNNMSINRSPSRGYDPNSTLDLIVARSEVNKQTQQFLDQIKNQQTMINNILKNIEQSNEKGNKRLKDNARVFKETMDYALNRGEMSTEQQLEFMKLYAKILEEAGKKYIANENSTKKQVQYGNQLLEQSREMLQNAKELDKALKSSSDNMFTRMSNSLHEFRTDFQDMLNTLNINSLSNMLTQQGASNRMAVMNAVKQQFGLNNSEFESFKNDLLGQAQTINSNLGKSLIGSQDVYDTMQRMIDIGITDTAVAQDQLQALMLGNKYLGQSTESQTLLYKYIKRTGDADLANKWNKTIAGLLDSQLGVSKQQLDAITSLLFSSTDTKSKMGWTEEEIEQYNTSAAILGTALSSTFGNEKGKNLLSTFDDLMSTDSADAIESLEIMTGGRYDYIQSLAKQGDTLSAFQMLSESIQGWMNTVQSSGNSLAMAKTYGALESAGIDTSFFSDFTGVTSNFDKLTDNFNTATSDLESFLASGKTLEDWISETTDATWEEQMQNAASLFIDKFPWSALNQAGNLVFGVYMVENILSLVGKIFGVLTGGTIINSLSDMMGGFFGKGSTIGKTAANLGTSGTAGKALGTLGLGLAVVGLTAAAIQGIANANRSGMDNAAQAAYEEAGKALEGTDAAGNTSLQSAYAVQEATNSQTWLGREGGNLTSGFSYMWTWMTTKDKNSRNKALTQWMYESGVLNNVQWAMAWAYMLDSIDSLKSFNEATGQNFTRETLKNAMETMGYTPSVINTNASKIINAGWKPYIDNDWNRMETFEIDPSLYNYSGQGGVEYYPVPSGRRAYNENYNFGIGGDGDSWTSLIRSPWIKVTSMWGNRPNPFGGGGTEDHGGIDIAAPSGTPIGSAVSGKVYTAGWVNGFGNAVYIQGNNGMNYIYGHMVRTPSVKTGQTVSAGQLIGYVGSTGRSTGPHLHFQVMKNGWYKANSVDPVPYLNTGVLYPRKWNNTRCFRVFFKQFF